MHSFIGSITTFYDNIIVLITLYFFQKNFQSAPPCNQMETNRYQSKPSNSNMSMEYYSDSWRQNANTYNEHQKRSRSANDNPNKAWATNNISGSFSSLNVVTSDDDVSYKIFV